MQGRMHTPAWRLSVAASKIVERMQPEDAHPYLILDAATDALGFVPHFINSS